MRRTSRTIGLGALLVSLAGCGFNSGFIRDSTSAQVMDYRMELSASRYVRSVQGSATDGSILCIFPLNGEQYTRAMNELYRAAALKPNETLQNLRQDSATRIYIVYCTHSLTISGDVIEVTPKADNPSMIVVPTQSAPASPATPLAPPAQSTSPVKPAPKR